MKAVISKTVIPFFILAILLNCGGRTNKYLLGIEVPIGNETVSADKPYLIFGVYEGSPGDKAGLLPDDVIQSIDDVDLNGMKYDDVYSRLLLGNEGSSVKFTVLRKGEKIEISVVRGK